MGREAAKAIRARQRRTAARIDRLITERDDREPSAISRRERIKAAVRAGRLAVRAWRSAQCVLEAAEARTAASLARITAEGLSIDEAIEALGLHPPDSRRLIHATSGTTRRPGVASSTDSATRRAHDAPAGHGETGGPVAGDATVNGDC